MRWTTPKLEDGEIFTQTKFLWFPLRIGDETRWLERATIEYRVDRDYYSDDPYFHVVRFVDD